MRNKDAAPTALHCTLSTSSTRNKSSSKNGNKEARKWTFKPPQTRKETRNRTILGVKRQFCTVWDWPLIQHYVGWVLLGAIFKMHIQLAFMFVRHQKLTSNCKRRTIPLFGWKLERTNKYISLQNTEIHTVQHGHCWQSHPRVGHLSYPPSIICGRLKWKQSKCWGAHGAPQWRQFITWNNWNENARTGGGFQTFHLTWWKPSGWQNNKGKNDGHGPIR